MLSLGDDRFCVDRDGAIFLDGEWASIITCVDIMTPSLMTSLFDFFCFFVHRPLSSSSSSAETHRCFLSASMGQCTYP